MDYLPLFLDIKNKPCLIVGGGIIAERKVSILSRAQAAITIIAPEITAEIKRKLDNKIVWHEKTFSVDDLASDLNTYQVDGSGVTPLWQGGTAPTGGNASSTDVYSFTIIKTADATFTCLASQSKFA